MKSRVITALLFYFCGFGYLLCVSALDTAEKRVILKCYMEFFQIPDNGKTTQVLTSLISMSYSQYIHTSQLIVLSITLLYNFKSCRFLYCKKVKMKFFKIVTHLLVYA